MLNAAVPVLAQAVFDLPPGTPAPSTRPAGPVDPDAPVIRPRPIETATPQPVPAASAAPPEPAPPPSAASASQRPAASKPRQSVRVAAQPVPEPTAAAASSLPAIATFSAPVTTAPTTAAPANRTFGWLSFAAGALVGALALAALTGLLLRRAKAKEAVQINFEPPVVPSVSSQPVAPAPPRLADSLQIELQARRLDASLMATTLAYSLTLKNTGDTALHNLEIQGDLIAAHASLPVEKQIASADHQLELRHVLADLPRGETAEFKGQMRLPLAAITPIRAGNAAYFVALARLRVEAEQPAEAALVLAQTFVVGELPERPGGALRPFRLDLGPRTFGRLGQRAVG